MSHMALRDGGGLPLSRSLIQGDEAMRLPLSFTCGTRRSAFPVSRVMYLYMCVYISSVMPHHWAPPGPAPRHPHPVPPWMPRTASSCPSSWSGDRTRSCSSLATVLIARRHRSRWSGREVRSSGRRRWIGSPGPGEGCTGLPCADQYGHEGVTARLCRDATDRATHSLSMYSLTSLKDHWMSGLTLTKPLSSTSNTLRSARSAP